ncbi:CBS domain-containing protein [Syntrophobacter fumaroxidans]|uniref:Putative signal-transduction protein with CBS domains n=1 Tax=Syntrophobacter fumaroxidans (strain DSM 10017 / MPOB) TaxID=335543 RepID=A0LLN6_SYNFM|nr:CBS domain-containing protein [Syntrophobacter fumaroxidans]ABK18338.1 putative signal-transduction protein with CBS domains [Syntrophobacter fumaroxidans MPOB]
MTRSDGTNVLSDIKVREAMRKIPVYLSPDSQIELAVRCAVKFKINAVLIIGQGFEAVGVISKTDLMYAYYAGLPISAPVAVVMRSPPLFCRLDDSLDRALDVMRESKVSRLYVLGNAPGQAVGVLSYPDIVGLLYRYCHKCEFNTLRSKRQDRTSPVPDIFKVCEVMGPVSLSFRAEDSLLTVMEGMSASGEAALILDENGLPVGVVSKTDLILAYRHGVPTTAQARAVMSSPVRSCDKDETLVNAIQKMIFSDLHRFFVCRGNPENIVGVISLADAARVRSGSCRACMPSRITL